MESVWIFKLDLRFLMHSISKTKQPDFPWHLLENGLRDCHAVKLNFVPYVLVT